MGYWGLVGLAACDAPVSSGGWGGGGEAATGVAVWAGMVEHVVDDAVYFFGEVDDFPFGVITGVIADGDGGGVGGW